MSRNWTFTSESVTEGHPDKVADQVSDAVLDAILAEDPHARVACETLVTTGLCLVSGEITTDAYVDIAETARSVIKASATPMPISALTERPAESWSLSMHRVQILHKASIRAKRYAVVPEAMILICRVLETKE